MSKIDPRLAALAAGNFAHGSATMATIGLLNEIAADLDVSIAVAGQVTTAMQLSAAVAAPLVAFFGGGIRQRTLLLAALALTALCQFAAALAPAFAVLLLARTAAGFGAAAYVPTAAGTASQLVEPARRGSAVAIVYSGFTVAITIGVPTGVWLGGEFGWRVTMAALGVLALASLAMLAMLVPAQPPAAAGEARKAWRSVLRNGAMLGMLAFSLLQAGAQMLFYGYIAPLLRVALDAGPGTIGLALGWAGLWGVAGSAISIRLIDRLGPVRLLATALAGILAAVALWPFAAGSLATVLVLLALWGAGSIMLLTGQQAQVVHMDYRVAGTALPMLSCTTFAGGVVGPALGGLVITLLGLGAVPWTAAAMFVLSALALGMVARLSRAPIAARVK